MRLFAFIIFVAVILLATCSAPELAPLPVETEMPALPTASLQPTDTGLPTMQTKSAVGSKLPAPSFDSETYINESAGFALEYPAGWTVNEAVIGSRGTQIRFLSSSEIAEMATLPEGETRVSATLYQWDPKNDLVAFIANQKNAWEASGFTILEEEQVVLELGLSAVRFTLQSPEADVVLLLAALDDRYLVLSGEGDLDLAKEIIQRVRPVSR